MSSVLSIYAIFFPVCRNSAAAGRRQGGGDRDRQGIIYNEAAAAVRWAAPAYLSSVPGFRADGKIPLSLRRDLCYTGGKAAA